MEIKPLPKHDLNEVYSSEKLYFITLQVWALQEMKVK